MNRTFLVDLDVGSDTDFLGIAEDIRDDLEAADYVVLSVKPWASGPAPLPGTPVPPKPLAD